MQRLSKYKKFIQDTKCKSKSKQHWYSFFSPGIILPKEISDDECLKENCADLDMNISIVVWQFVQSLFPKTKIAEQNEKRNKLGRYNGNMEEIEVEPYRINDASTNRSYEQLV